MDLQSRITIDLTSLSVNQLLKPHQILNTAEQVLNGTLNNKIARNYRDEVWTIFENKASEQEFQSLEYQKPINAGLSAFSILKIQEVLSVN